MKVLVTGATGFIGSHLVDALVQGGVEVRCLVRRTSDLRWLKDRPVEYVYGDCTDRSSLAEAVGGVDRIYHLAGATKVKRDEDFFTINATGTENLIRACLEHNPGLQKFLYLSSQAASGPSANGRMKTESDPNFPISSYGRSKRIGEEAVLDHRKDLAVTILRPSAVYGPRDKDFLSLLQLISKRITFSLLGITQRISMCFADDLVQAILRAGEPGRGDGGIFFISDGQAYRMEEIGEAFSRAMGKRTVRLRVPASLIQGIGWISEATSRLTGKSCLLTRHKAKEMIQENWTCDITQARAMLGYLPRVSLDQGAGITVDWYRKQNWL